MRFMFRWGGIFCVIAGVYFRLNALAVLRPSYSWSGDFARSKAGVLLDGFGDIMVVLTLLGGIAFLMSFTNLLDNGEGRPKRNESEFKPE